MVTARKPTTATYADLIEIFRGELEYRNPHELLVELVKLPSMKRTTRAKIWALLDRPRSEVAALKLAESAIRSMDAAEVEAWLKREAVDRLEAQARHARSQLFASLARAVQPASAERAQKIAAILETARRVDAALPVAPENRLSGSMGATELLLHRALDAADQAELVKMLEAVLLVASDRVVDAIEPERQSEERMLAEYHVDQRIAGERSGPARKASAASRGAA